MDKKKRIVLLTKMAMYDKLYGKEDSKVDSYFMHDYISRQNIITRFCVAIGGILLLCFYWLHQYAINNVNLLLVDWITELPRMAIFLVALMIFYSVIGFIKWGRKYKVSQNRRKKYYSYNEQLQASLTKPKIKKTKEARRKNYGANIID